MITLGIEASASVGSVVVLRAHAAVGTAEAEMRQAAREGLLPAVDEALRSAGVELSDVDCVVCGAGPGSFTSLRVAAGLAKGIATARALPLYAVSSLALIAAGADRADGAYLVETDALRGERFVAGYRLERGSVCQELMASQLALSRDIAGLAGKLSATVIGPELDGSIARASALQRLAPTANLVQLVDVESWEPVYGRLPAAQTREQSPARRVGSSR